MHHPGEKGLRGQPVNNYLQRTFTIKVATMKIMDDFHFEWKPSHVYHKSTVGKDEWDTKEGIGKSIVCTAVWQKAPL